MIIIGEKLNSSVPKTLDALNRHDLDYVVRMIKQQELSGADYLDLNTALTGENEIDNMLWLIRLVKENSQCGIVIDSPNPDVIAHCLPNTKNNKTIINSITLDGKYDAVIEMSKQYGAGVVCLPIKEKSVPNAAGERFAYAVEIAAKLRHMGIEDENIYIDILVEAIATNSMATSVALETTKLVKKEFPKINTICGLSNVSFGLPRRAKLNGAFFIMMIQNGLDGAIVDITSDEIKNAIFTSNALLGKDEYCMEYIAHSRKFIK